MLVTLTPAFRVHRDSVLRVTQQGGHVTVRFDCLPTRRFAIDDLTPEAREWLVPSLAPQEIHWCECEEIVVDTDAADEAQNPAGSDSMR